MKMQKFNTDSLTVEAVPNYDQANRRHNVTPATYGVNKLMNGILAAYETAQFMGVDFVSIVRNMERNMDAVETWQRNKQALKDINADQARIIDQLFNI